MSMFGVPVFIRAAIFILFSIIFPLFFLFCFVFVFSDSFHLKKYFVKNENCGLQSVCSTLLSSCSYFSPTLSFSQLVSTGWWLKGVGRWGLAVTLSAALSSAVSCSLTLQSVFLLNGIFLQVFLKQRSKNPNLL